ncbi:sugar ABC transporter ATP-binding protein [Lichenicoccus sp.]|uniref:sugar ABC transporter ATP-binding protein n=1 Tax=Lichenicoccus sp. TaxID=2781899 RepID=UPI003D0BC31A
MLLATRGLGKSFGNVVALRDVSFDVAQGEVHGLMGENGAGKSTLIKLLTGLHQASAGEILLDGAPVAFASPREAQRAGVAAVYQEINLIPERSVAANIYLGREPRRGPLTDSNRMVREAAALLSRYGLGIDPRRPLRSLGLGLQQMVSIARVVSLGARVVIMDEPTSALSGAEVEVLFGVVEQLRNEGKGIVYVSHRLSECYRLCDRLTVLRDGAKVESARTADLPRGRLIAAMLGREAAAAGPDRSERAAHARAVESGALALGVRGLSWRRRVVDVSLSVRRGEILGLAGLLGSGRTETLKAIYGAETPERGSVALEERPLGSLTPSRSIRNGLAFLSEDRRAEGIFPRLSVRENLTAAVLPRISRFGVVSRRRQTELVERYVASLGIKTSGPAALISELSGGNQQKVLIARALCTAPKVVMLDDPTRGIDVGAKAEVHRAIRALAREGLGVLVTSSEVEEIMELADRLVVLSEGAVSGELTTAGREPEDVLALLAGTESAGTEGPAAS